MKTCHVTGFSWKSAVGMESLGLERGCNWVHWCRGRAGDAEFTSCLVGVVFLKTKSFQFCYGLNELQLGLPQLSSRNGSYYFIGQPATQIPKMYHLLHFISANEIPDSEMWERCYCAILHTGFLTFTSFFFFNFIYVFHDTVPKTLRLPSTSQPPLLVSPILLQQYSLSEHSRKSIVGMSWLCRHGG